MHNSQDSSAHTTSQKPSVDSPKGKPQPSSNSNLLTPSELALMKRDFEQSDREMDEMLDKMIERGELPATI